MSNPDVTLQKPEQVPPAAEIKVPKLEHGGELTEFVKSVALPLHLGNRTTAARLVADYLKLEVIVKNDETALAILSSFLQYLLDGNRYVDAATLLWPATLFSGEPRGVKLVWDALFESVTVAVPGAASMGKSYCMGVWLYLDWRRDPWFTNIQVVGPSEGHLERNLFSHLAKLHKNASIPGPGEVVQLGITLDTVERNSGIFGIVVPIGKKAAGRLQGVKVFPRPKPHPQFGALSRLRVMLEEAENIPVGIMDDLTNILANARGLDTFKAMAAYNPKDPNHPIAQRVEPIDGMHSIDIETDEKWISKRGWTVVRLDAYKSENVTKGQEIFFGLQTKKGLETVILNAGGVGTAGYYTMARGWYPPTGVDLAVIPQHLVTDIWGDYQFSEAPRPIGAVDVALEGGDNAIFVLGRFGLASGWNRPIDGGKPVFVPFKNGMNEFIRREVIQVDQIFTMPKGDTIKLVNEIVRIAKNAMITGENLGVDRTGNGAGVHDLLVSTPGFRSTKGINPSSSPTERHILQEDTKLPVDEYAYLLSELWFAARKYIEFGLLKISKNVASDPLIGELTGRRFLLTQKKTKVESKKDYKSRGNRSPDRADGLTYLTHVARLISSGPPSALNGSSREMQDDRGEVPQTVGLTDRPDYL